MICFNSSDINLLNRGIPSLISEEDLKSMSILYQSKYQPVSKTLISTEISTNYIPINGAKIRSTTDKYSHYKSYSQFLP